VNLIKTGLLNSIAVGVRLLTSVGLNKILAIYVGPSGYAVIGQLNNFITMLVNAAGGAVNTGVIKYTAEYCDDEKRQIAIWKTAGTIATIVSISLGFIIAVSYQPLANLILKGQTHAEVFIFLGAGLLFFTLNALLLAILNGKKEIKRYVLVNIIGSVVGLLATGALSVLFGLFGALIALAINQSIVFCVTLALCWRRPWFKLSSIFGHIDPESLRSLGKYALLTVVSTACLPISQILIRNHITRNFGWQAAGHWEALIRISSLYLMVVTTPLSIYYLPRLSEIRNSSELKREISRGYCLILPVAVMCAFSIYALKNWIILILFTDEFAPMRDLFAWQLMGDVMKIGSWLISYLMLGRAMVKLFIFTEVLFSVSWVMLVILFTGFYGVQGAQIAYCTNYIIYWATIAFLCLKRINNI